MWNNANVLADATLPNWVVVTGWLGPLVVMVLQYITSTYQASQTNRILDQANKISQQQGGQVSLPYNPPRLRRYLPTVATGLFALAIWIAILYDKSDTREHTTILYAILSAIVLAIILAAIIALRSKSSTSRSESISRDRIQAPSAEVRITFPTGAMQFPSDPISVRGTYSVLPAGKWMLWTRHDTGYWPQGVLVFSPNEKTWTATARINVNVPGITNILVAEVSPEVVCLVNFYQSIGTNIKWNPISIPERLEGFKIAHEVTVLKLTSPTLATTGPIKTAQLDNQTVNDNPTQQAANLANLHEVEELFGKWKTRRENWELMGADLGGQDRLRLASDTNGFLEKLGIAAKPLLPIAAHFDINASILTMMCNESRRFFLPGGERGFEEDRRSVDKALNELSGCLQYGGGPKARVVERDDKNVALSKDDAYQEFRSFGNVCDEIKAAKVVSGAPNLGLPDDLSAAIQCVHEAARQAAFIRWMLIDPDVRASRLQDIGKSLEKLLFTDAPAARKAYRLVEQKLILARESLKGDALPTYNDHNFPSMHEAAIKFIEDIFGNCGVNSQESSFSQADQYKMIGRRLSLLPRVDGQRMTSEMKREAVQAAHLTTG